MDGNEEKTGLYDFKDTTQLKISFPDWGTSLGSNQILLSQVNIWNRVLTSQEIKILSGKCDAGVNGLGNVVSWADLYDVSKTAVFSKPSTCEAQSGQTQDKATAISTQGHIQDFPRGTRIFPKRFLEKWSVRGSLNLSCKCDNLAKILTCSCSILKPKSHTMN